MVRSIALSLILTTLLGGCQQSAPVVSGFQIAAAPETTEIIVQFKEASGRHAVEKDVPGLAHERSLLLNNRTHLYSVHGDAADALDRLTHNPHVAYAEPNVTLHAFLMGDDPYIGGVPDWNYTKIQAPEAWDVTLGSPDVTVAVVDTGVNYNHPDLSNGQVIPGPDLVNQDNDPMDDQGHGTHVAGTIAATFNNGLGIAGVASSTKVLAIKVLDSTGSGSLANVADGIVTAQQLGARVVNLSLGGAFSTSTLQQAVDQVTAAGTLVVAAAGNDGNKRASYPAAYDNAFAVGASTQTDARASFSNYGSFVDIAAPGVSIYSTTGDGYASWNGTSMATPHVAAAAALLLAVKPAATVADLRHALQTGDDPVSGFSGGIGRLNVFKALAVLQAPAPEPTPTPTPTPEPSPSSPGNPKKKR